MSQSHREYKVVLNTLPVPAAAQYDVAALGDSKLFLNEGNGIYGKTGFFIVDLESPEPVMQFEYPSNVAWSVFCVSKDKKLIVIVSDAWSENCCIWRVETDKVRELKKVDIPLKEEIKKILLCNDNTHLISITMNGDELSVFNLDTQKYRTFKKDELLATNLYDICLLEKDDTTKLFVAADNGLFMFDVSFMSEKILNNPQQLRSQKCQFCDVSPDSSCLAVVYDADAICYGAIYHIDKNFSLTEFGNFELGRLMEIELIRFLDDHVLAFMCYSYGEIFMVNLDSDELKAVRQTTGLVPAADRRAPATICAMPDGSMLHISSGNLYSRMPAINSLYTQALEKLFHHQVLASLPTNASLDVAKVILSYTQAPVKNSAFFESKSVESEQECLESILDELIKSPGIPVRDQNALALFKAIHVNFPGISLKKCLAIMQQIAKKEGYEIQISFGLSKFFAKIQHLDLPAKKLEGPSPRL